MLTGTVMAKFTDQDKYRVGKPAADLLMGLSSSLRYGTGISA